MSDETSLLERLIAWFVGFRSRGWQFNDKSGRRVEFQARQIIYYHEMHTFWDCDDHTRYRVLECDDGRYVLVSNEIIYKVYRDREDLLLISSSEISDLFKNIIAKKLGDTPKVYRLDDTHTA